MAGDFPIGAVLGFGGDANSTTVLAQLVAQGWLLCDGSVMKVSDYAELGALLGTRYGGDGTTTFGLPDLRGLFVRGTDHGRGIDPVSDRAVGSVQAYATGQPKKAFATDTQWSDHTHNAPHLPNDNHHTSLTIGTPPETMNWTDDTVNSTTSGEHDHKFDGGESETRPTNLYLYYVIKYQRQTTVDDLVIATVTPFAADATEDSVREKLQADGWMMCDGSMLDQKDYKKLYDMIGTSYGTADGSFLIPDLRGLFTKGPADPDRAVASVEQYKTHLPTAPAFSLTTSGDHKHGVSHLPTDKLVSYVVAGNNQAAWNGGGGNLGIAGAHNHTILGGDPESRPINMALDFIIKVS